MRTLFTDSYTRHRTNPDQARFRVLSVKQVRKKRIYLKSRLQIHPFVWLEFLEDASFSLGVLSQRLKLTEYGSAIQRGFQFKEHAGILRRGDTHISEAKSPHYSFHPPRILQTAGVVHMVDQRKKIDEWELNWFPVRTVDHILTIYSGDIEHLGTVRRPKKNYSLVVVPGTSLGMRMDLFICPARVRVELDPLAKDNIIGGCKHYNLICSFYSDDTPQFAMYVTTEMKEQKTGK